MVYFVASLINTCFLFIVAGKYAARIALSGAIYTAAAIEYLVAEIIELAGDCTKENMRALIIPRHIMLAIQNDQELKELLRGVHIAYGGVVPNIHPFLLPRCIRKEKDAFAPPTQHQSLPQ